MILVVACGSGPHKERQGIRRRALRPSTSPRPAAINPSRAGPGLSLPPSPTPRPAGPAAMLRAMLPPAGPEAQGAAAGPGASRAEPSRCEEGGPGAQGLAELPAGGTGCGVPPCVEGRRGERNTSKRRPHNGFLQCKVFLVNFAFVLPFQS